MTTLAKHLDHLWRWTAHRLEGVVSLPGHDTAAPRAARSCLTAGETDRDLPAICSGWSALMASAQNGDRAAYRRLLTEIADLVRGWGRRSGIQGPASEELVCDVLRTLHRVRHTYQPSRPFMPWLLAVLRYETGEQGCRVRDVLRDQSACAGRISETAERASDAALRPLDV